MKKHAPRRRPPNYYLGRQFQRRLLLLFGVLMGLLLMVQFVRKPHAFTWLMQGPLKPQAEERIDNRLRPRPQRPEIPGTFVARAETEPSDGSDGLFPGINPGYLSDVRDDSPYRADENKAFFQMLHLLQEADQQQLANPTEVTYLQLYEQPEAYRGELVSIRGYVRAAWPRQAPGISFSPEHGLIGGSSTVTGMVCTPGNEYGIPGYTEIWLQPRERLSEVMMLYTLELPEGFPTGDSLKEDVTAIGIFFKRIAYGAKGTYRTTPLLLTKTLKRELPPPAPTDPKDNLSLLLIAAAVMLGLCVVVVVYVYRNSGSTASDQPEYIQRFLERNKEVKDPDFSGLDEMVADNETDPANPSPRVWPPNEQHPPEHGSS